jgi:hypothetical protein
MRRAQFNLQGDCELSNPTPDLLHINRGCVLQSTGRQSLVWLQRLHPDVRLIAPLEELTGKEAVLEAAQRL